jgi:hypothetical protein
MSRTERSQQRPDEKNARRIISDLQWFLDTIPGTLVVKVLLNGIADEIDRLQLPPAKRASLLHDLALLVRLSLGLDGPSAEDPVVTTKRVLRAAAARPGKRKVTNARKSDG